MNSKVPSVRDAIKRLEKAYADAARIDFTDGISVFFEDWHFNARPSANDPVMRLNLEATSQGLMEQKRDEVLAIIRNHEAIQNKYAGG